MNDRLKKKQEEVLSEVMTLSEAAERWEMPLITVKRWCAGSKTQEPKFYNYECRKSGKYWLITRTGMERMAGPEPEKEEKS